MTDEGRMASNAIQGRQRTDAMNGKPPAETDISEIQDTQENKQTMAKSKETALEEAEDKTDGSVSQDEKTRPMMSCNHNHNHKRPRPPFSIPALHDIHSHNLEIEAVSTFRHYQALHIPKISIPNNREQESSSTLKWTDIGTLFHSLDKDRPSWCVENNGPDKSILLPLDFFRAPTSKVVGYGSFLLQKDAHVLEETLNRLPLVELFQNTNWTHGPCVWFFFGLNVQEGKGDLQGRPEHTDSVSHDGTWHYQLSGSKRWYLRPTKELLESVPDATSVCIHVEEGDVLLVNTRLWWHRTDIPPQPNPSVSYARDFYMTSPTNATSSKGDSSSMMSNVDGLYAANDVEEGTIIFTEDDMPDCELPHSMTNPNCEVVELEDGTHALVSCRKILCGEFFCVADNDDDTSDNDQQDDDDDSNEAS